MNFYRSLWLTFSGEYGAVSGKLKGHKPYFLLDGTCDVHQLAASWHLVVDERDSAMFPAFGSG